MLSMLFTYGTLVPRDPESAAGEGWQPDAVRGRLYDLGLFPALVELDDAEAGWVEGYTRDGRRRARLGSPIATSQGDA